MPEDLFEDRAALAFAPGGVLLGGFAIDLAGSLMTGIAAVAAAAPFRRMDTPGGRAMSVAMTNCGAFGWITDRRGYRYVVDDPHGNRPWPDMPAGFAGLATAAARAAGYDGFLPDACLVNRYAPDARMTLHQDRDEAGFDHPIVSVSIGLSATFLWGSATRGGPVRRIALHHGDVVVWGGASRLNFHGVDRLRDGQHPAAGRYRYNLTFRRAG